MMWSNLSNLQIGSFSEAYSKMIFQIYGYSTYSVDVDDKGIDFLAESPNGKILKVQVKSLRGYGYVYMTKRSFIPSPDTLLCLLCYQNEEMPGVYIIPSVEWNNPNQLLVSHDYGEWKKSEPEWGINISKKNQQILDAYDFKSFFMKKHD